MPITSQLVADVTTNQEANQAGTFAQSFRLLFLVLCYQMSTRQPVISSSVPWPLLSEIKAGPIRVVG